MWDSDGNDGESAVRVLGAEGNGASSLFQGTTARTGSPMTGAASKSEQLETQAGSRMDAIDDDWDIDDPAAREAKPKAPAASEPETREAIKSLPCPTESLPSRGATAVSSNAASPAQTTPAPPSAVPPGAIASPSAVPPGAIASKVQLAAEAYQRRAGARKSSASRSVSAKPTSVAPTPTPPPAQKTASSGDAVVPIAQPPLVQAPAPGPATSPIQAEPSPTPKIDISPVVVLAEPLDLQEVASVGLESAPPPTTVPAEAAAVDGQSEPRPQPSTDPVQGKPDPEPASPPAPLTESAAPESRRSTPIKTTGAERRDSGLISLEASDAVEFFSKPPPATHFEPLIDPELVHEPRERTQQQLARQQYLRRLVVKFMLATVAFLVVVIYLLWRRGLLPTFR